MKLALPLLVVLLGSGCATKVKIDPGDGGSRSTSSDEPSASSGLGSLTGAGEEGGAGNIGSACSSQADCDPTGENEVCAGASDAFPSFSLDALDPTPVCMGAPNASCTQAPSAAIESCDHGAGVCAYVAEVAGFDCYPTCAFDDTGAAPTGCIGKNRCHPLGFLPSPDDKSAEGIGFCMGGCEDDSDCSASGQICEQQTDECWAAANVYSPSLALGTACDMAASNHHECYCKTDEHTFLGECTEACQMGIGSCPGGFECDAALPTSGDVVFTKAPVGLGGWCMLDCSQDADCPNGYCAKSAGTKGKTCHVGTKP